MTKVPEGKTSGLFYFYRKVNKKAPIGAFFIQKRVGFHSIPFRSSFSPNDVYSIWRVFLYS